MTLTKCFAGVALVTGTILAACESSSNNAGPNSVVSPDASFGVDSSAADSATRGDGASEAAPDGAIGDLFEGVWVGLQGAATVEISNAAGCTVMKDTVNGVLCDECVGLYGAEDAGAVSVVANCKPLAACSVSPPHTNTGTFTRGDGGALTFFYDYGFGSTSVDFQPTQTAPGDVCPVVDAGLD